MQITRFKNAPHYHAPNHVDMRCLRLQGHEATQTQHLWMGISQVLPGGHTGLDASPMEKHYVVLQGELVLISELDGQTTQATLAVHDSVSFAPGEKRQLVNQSNVVATVLLAMPYPPSSDTPRP
jgi:hypothetical protein